MLGEKEEGATKIIGDDNRDKLRKGWKEKKGIENSAWRKGKECGRKKKSRDKGEYC